MSDIVTRRISELIAAQDIGDSDLFVIEQGGKARKALGSVVKGAIGTPTQEQTDSAVADWLDTHPEATTTVQDGAITEAKLNTTIKAKINNAFPTEAKNALLALLEKVTYIDEYGQSYLYALESALFPPANLVSIDAVFTQGENVITNQDTLDDLRQYLMVTANYDDETTETVSNYTLSGELTRGTCTITVGYGGKTDTFDVYVTYVDTSIVYSLATPATLSGSGYINSNYAAFGTDRDLTITVSIVNSRSNARARFFATNNSNVSVSGYLTGANAFRFDYFGGNNSVTFSSPDYSKRMNVVLTHTAGSGKIDGYISYYNTSGTLVTKSVSVTAGSSPQTVANVVQFGGVSIANTQAINGTIYSAVIRTRVMDADEIQEFLTAEEV